MKDAMWYQLDHPEEIDSPSLLIYKDRIAYNIQTMISIAGDVNRLVPHVKTHKMAEIVKMQLAAGIHQFKCATIAEAEMLAEAGVKNILLAYQLNIPKISRFLSLVKKYPDIEFASLVDNIDSAKLLNNAFEKQEKTANVFIDVDTGMHRTGIAPVEALYDLYIQVSQLAGLRCNGLHVYDGHIRDEDFIERKTHCEKDFAGVNEVIKKIVNAGQKRPEVIAGGTPTFTVHALNGDVNCSPGTCILWDRGYESILKEQPFKLAAVLLTRVISKPEKGVITTDLGHKSVAAENLINKRIFFLSISGYNVRSQSEEHLVVEVKDWEQFRVGDVLYGIPYHICPTVALYDEAIVVENGKVSDQWKITARRKKITL